MAGLAILAAAACTKVEKDSKPVQGGAVLTVNAHAPQTNQPETKVTLNPTDLIKWYSSDKSYAGLFLPGKGFVKSDLSGSSISDDGQQATFKFISSNISLSSNTARIVYPCTSSQTTSNMDYKFSLPSVQNLSSLAGSATSSDSSAAVPMISDVFSVKSSSGETSSSAEASAKMHILSSIVAFYVYDSEQTHSSESVKSIELQSSSVAISSPTSVTLATDNEVPSLSGTSSSAKVQFSNSSYYFSLLGKKSKEDSSPIYLSIIPSEFVGKVIVETTKAFYVFPFEASKKFMRAEVKDFYLNLSNPKAEVVAPSAIEVTKAYREKQGSGCVVTLTVKLSDNAAGFYAYVGSTQKLKASELLSASKYLVGQDDNDSFTKNEDGTIDYKVKMYQSFSFSVLPFDENGILGIGEGLGDEEVEDYLGYISTKPVYYGCTKTDDLGGFKNYMVKFNN